MFPKGGSIFIQSFQCIFGKQMIQKYSLSDQTVLIEIALYGINERHVFVYDWINRLFIYNNQSEKCLPKISKSIISASGCGNVKLDLLCTCHIVNFVFTPTQ